MLGATVACSLASLADLSSGGDDAGAGPVAEAGPVADSSSDTRSRIDGGLDAPADAPPDGTFCEVLRPVPTFCDDFERTNVQGTWDALNTTAGSAVTLAASTRGTGKELLTSISLTTGGPASAADLDRSFPQSDELSISYALRVDGPPSQGQQQLMNVFVTIPSNGDRYTVSIFASTSGIVLAEQTFPGGGAAGGVFLQHPLAQGLPFNVWTRVELLLRTTAPKRLLLKVGGEVAFDAAPDAFLRPGTIDLSAGIHYTAPPTGPLSVRVDDLVVDAK